jgi:hypothetical protein
VAEYAYLLNDVQLGEFSLFYDITATVIIPPVNVDVYESETLFTGMGKRSLRISFANLPL